MQLRDGICWGLVPARSGSKSVALKNLALLGGRPLLDYGVLAARQAGLERIVCSTDGPEIAARSRELGIVVDDRPTELAGDEAPVFDVIARWLTEVFRREGAVPEMVALIQPTSPFITPAQIQSCVALLQGDPEAASAQTVIPCPHNHHAYNQRLVADGRVTWRFPDERRAAYNKQRKPEHFLFGNLVVFRSQMALDQGSVFAERSLASPVPEIYGFDCDGPDDFRRGTLMLESGLVELPHLDAQFDAQMDD